MEPNANTNKDDITPPETKPNQPETPARLLIAILVVAAGSAGASISFTLCSSYTLLFSLISGFAITLIPAVALAVVSNEGSLSGVLFNAAAINGNSTRWTSNSQSPNVIRGETITLQFTTTSGGHNLHIDQVSFTAAVPVLAAAWLLVSALRVLTSIARRDTESVVD